KIADRSRALLPPAQKGRKQSQQTPVSDLCTDPLVRPEESVEGDEQQAFLSEISEEDVEVLRQREEALLQIERDMLDVNQIMKDLASMVHEQGDTIDSIEEYIQTTSSHVESANQELAKASHHQGVFLSCSQYSWNTSTGITIT
ncbi:t-SNARE domain-containing protein 1, partial [Clarias magur]